MTIDQKSARGETTPVTILIAEDSELFATVLKEAIGEEPDMQVVGLATDGERAVELCAELEPDLVLMDIRMPKLDGLSATETIMADCPTPILVVTSDPYQGGVDMSFRALSAGALDLVKKPESMPWNPADRHAFLRKVRLLAQIPVVRHQRASSRRKRVAYRGRKPERPTENALMIGIVASTGGPKALARMLSELPDAFPAPILVVQHIITGFSAHLASWLDSVSALEVKEAKSGDSAKPGCVYLAPADVHMRLEAGRRLSLVEGDPVAGHIPSGDVLLESLARRHPSRAIGVILSGMGSDGTTGLAAIHRGGGVTMVQDRDSSVVWGMPQSAIDLGVVQEIVHLDELAATLVRQVERLEDER